ncbi:hypothetical protein OG568_34715 [Streptomyces sp. NBC_01450]|uniref:hypothetical protein n=1 Tax=Streptomyces sp. NBC_01450 TaxID=2903871 RepID=UPI002E30FB54|nr:hypothetical protein [Streptomyces sp. NBC_01450]
MNARHWKRSVILGSTLILALAPVGLPQASAATPNETHASAPASVSGQREYRQGFKDGFRDGYADARDDCRKHGGRYGWSHSKGDYVRGYSDGFSAGFTRAEDRYC